MVMLAVLHRVGMRVRQLGSHLETTGRTGLGFVDGCGRAGSMGSKSPLLPTVPAGIPVAGFVGMLTDSRSFLSYPRHEYFRRILCRLLGEWVEDGRFPQDYDILGEIVTGISANNARKYFSFPTK